ncbi:hypothetical protein SCOCK_10113 [Actinacidiphila cocklensis]|uniref:Uncharacterized protein n=1 Tax=Actinacidiphila cocklensis TaxID=887465 RepID=A0A9W4E148_9ACTN|nr:hypothetical protein SCOCK_10113 [Actinacidiphila cocklensis]
MTPARASTLRTGLSVFTVATIDPPRACLYIALAR